MESHYIAYKNSTIHYAQFGNGSKLLFCFHGYGRESYTFSILERKLGKLFTIIALDIPYHGLTNWKEEQPFKPDDLVQFLLQIRIALKKENIKFTLLGFSMGGRIALHLTQQLAGEVEKLVLLAPDGLQFNLLRFSATETWAGNKIFKYTIYNPAWLLKMIKRAEKLKFIHGSVADFALYFINDEKHRMLLYQRLIAVKEFKVPTLILKKLIRKYKIPVKMLFGRFDKVIPFAGGENFKKGIEEFASIKVIDAGHHLLSEAHVDKIVQLIND